MNKLIIYLVIAVILIVGAVGAYAVVDRYVKEGEINSPEGRYVMEVSGRANYGFAGIGSWSITDITYNVHRMSVQDLTIVGLQPFWFWESGEVSVECTLRGISNAYSDSHNIGQFHVLLGESKTWKCTIPMITPSQYDFDLSIVLYEGNLEQATETIENIDIG